MNRIAHLAHLTKRFMSSLSRQPPPPADEAWAVSVLNDGESVLWELMSNADRRHSIEVARRLQSDHPDAGRDAIAAALLHDIGKIRSRLGTMARVAATIIGPRTRRFRLYHDHERLGAEMLRKIGSSPATIAIVDGTSSDAVVVAALRAADDI